MRDLKLECKKRETDILTLSVDSNQGSKSVWITIECQEIVPSIVLDKEKTKDLIKFLTSSLEIID